MIKKDTFNYIGLGVKNDMLKISADLFFGDR